MHVTVIGGAGSVGSSVAYTLAVTIPEVRLRMVDVRSDTVAGHGTDIEHAMNHRVHPVGEALASDVQGGKPPVTSMPPDSTIVEDTDCIVVVYNVSRTESAVQRGGRESYFEHNREVADEIGSWMADSDPCPVVVVTNPVDRITHRLWTQSGWPRDYFLGYSLSETARAAAEIGRLFDVDSGIVSCPMMGEHGEHVVPVFSQTTIGDEAVEFTRDQRQQILEYVRDVPYDIMRQRGPDESSRWVSGRGAAAVVHALHNGGTDDPVCLSVPLDGEYGYTGVCLSVPVVLSPRGWDSIEQWSLSRWERNRLDAAYGHLSSPLPE